MRFTKEELDDLINVQKITHSEIGRRYSVSGVYVQKTARFFGLVQGKVKTYPPKDIENSFCLNCGKKIEPRLGKNRPGKYCNNKCQGEFRKKQNIGQWLSHSGTFNNPHSTPKFIKPYILEDQEHKCSICKTPDVWNDKHMVFVLDHIDGDASNNHRDNLRLVCHNCDSQLPTYKRRNKKSSRISRYNK